MLKTATTVLPSHCALCTDRSVFGANVHLPEATASCRSCMAPFLITKYLIGESEVCEESELGERQGEEVVELESVLRSDGPNIIQILN